MGAVNKILVVVGILFAIWYFAPDQFDDGREWVYDTVGNFTKQRITDKANEGLSDNNGTVELSCVDSGGEWETFTDACADICNPSPYCTNTLTDSCDCGPGLCWDSPDCVEK